MRPWNFQLTWKNYNYIEGNKKDEYAPFLGEGLDILNLILGSSTESALLAAAKGLPYDFESFCPSSTNDRARIYRNTNLRSN
jgi:hypothetical protein